MTSKIDYIITFLDPTDPYWLEQFKPYQDNEFKQQRARYDEDGIRHLKYNFRGLAKNLPWINNLYLVVFSESQVPSWINRDTVKVVTDDMFIPDKFRPTFNTSTKQMHLHMIPGLEEHFIFGDDDQFSINPISASQFFDERTGQPRPSRVSNLANASLAKQDSWSSIAYNSINFAHKITGIDRPWLPMGGGTFPHLPNSMLKSDISGYYGKNIEEIEKSITPCRNARNIIGVAWIVANNLKYRNLHDIREFGIHGYNQNIRHDLLKYQRDGVQVVCINNNPHGDFYQKQFEQMFPEKCKYEV